MNLAKMLISTFIFILIYTLANAAWLPDGRYVRDNHSSDSRTRESTAPPTNTTIVIYPPEYGESYSIRQRSNGDIDVRSRSHRGGRMPLDRAR